MKNVGVGFVFSAFVLMSCGENTDKTQAPTQMACQTEVTALDIRDNGKGRALANFIDLASIKPSPTMVGYGPAANPKAEVTIIDGVYYLTRPDGDAVQTNSLPSKDQNAVFLITSAPDAWMSGGELPEVGNLVELSAAIGAQAGKLGCGSAAVFPFKVKAYARSLTWSITGSPKGMKGDIENTEIIIVGVYDNSGAPRNAMMAGMNIHPHVYISSDNISGHLNAVELAPGASLYVPGQIQKGNENEK